MGGGLQAEEDRDRRPPLSRLERCRIIVTVDRKRRELEAQRRQLLDQLAAVDAAIASLTSEPAPDALVARRVKAKRVLSDAHKQALIVSKRRAREIQEADKGLAREKHDDSFVPAIRKGGDRQQPRLVKRPGRG